MSLNHTKGNLIDMAEQGLFDVIVHGCNCQNTMGSGIAKEIRARYPVAYREDTGHSGLTAGSPMAILCLGNYSIARACGNPKVSSHRFNIVNAYTQLNYLPRGIDHFEYDSFALILRKLAAVYPGKRFGFPYIGMGLAGGDSKRIVYMLSDFADQVEKTGGSATLVEFG